jgi:hypothetical protein
MPKWIPTAPEVLREAVIVLAGAALAALVVNAVLPAEWRRYFALPTQQANNLNA